ncbi:GAP family protein [Mycobacterium sp. OTB74]|jgi:hypothetical protein|uniref:GAP family protein n=1 Tax=Mycobacterium sp. OTB74 TaxID=1853452 RepID=UPI0024749389|nr:GAP family protein [Mycobacterium sp. OTB74]MDH6247911.1 hypothetical protein [Mycobacterium sp. OTB74]
MWVTVLVLALAVNLEPARIGIITLMLSKPRPIVHLLAFLLTTFAVTTGVGLLVLFVFHRSLLTGLNISGAKVQIGMGVIALLVAAVLAISQSRPRSKVGVDPAGAPLQQAPNRALTTLSTVTRRLVHADSPLLSGAMGLGVAVPSVDYMALLMLIAASGAAPIVQAGQLLSFVVVGNIVVAIPLLLSMFTPERTRQWVAWLQGWVSSRTRRDFAVLLAVIGVIMVGAGIHGS